MIPSSHFRTIIAAIERAASIFVSAANTPLLFLNVTPNKYTILGTEGPGESGREETNMNATRIETLLERMNAEGIGQMLVADPPSIYYLTGRWIRPGERMLVLYLNAEGQRLLFVNDLFPVEAIPGVGIVRFNDTDDPVGVIAGRMDGSGSIGVDKNWPARFLLPLMARFGAEGFVNGSAILDRMRMCKDAAEIAFMREASRLNDAGMARLIERAGAGTFSERRLGRDLLEIYEDLGAGGFSFPPIVAFGANAADPHHEPGDSFPKPGDSIILDIGCLKDSYCADMTRTVFFREVPGEAREVYEIVREANRRAAETVRPGARFCDIDRAARGVIEKAGYGPYFNHRTGHSIGLDVHDFGDVSPVNEARIEPGMIFSIEPGIYLEGRFGVRIEDLALVTESGCEILNAHPRELKVIG